MRCQAHRCFLWCPHLTALQDDALGSHWQKLLGSDMGLATWTQVCNQAWSSIANCVLASPGLCLHPTL